MAKKTNENRYPGVDSQPWTVRTSKGERVIKESFTGFGAANQAAERYTNETGEWAGAVRA